MSTLRLSVGLLILLLLLGLVGCTSTSDIRTANAPKMRTVASIGDKPLPIVTGDPGEAVTGDSEPTGRQSRAALDGRISGRVVDDQGEPVAGAQVRLAVGAAPGGRLNQATTDRAGGFTLRGLRPGTSYTVIAEWEDAQGVLTGRANAEAPDAAVEIALVPAEAGALASGGSERLDPVSRRTEVPPRDRAEEQVAGSAGTPINIEDLPPAPEAEVVSPASRRKARVQTRLESAPDETFPASSAGAWCRLDRTRSAAPDPDANPDDEPALAPGRGAGLPTRGTPPADDDGPNPLPPALEPGQALRPASDPDSGAEPLTDELAMPARQLTALTHEEEQTPSQEPPGNLVAAPHSSGPMSASAVVPVAELPAPVEQTPRSEPVASNDSLLPPPVESGAPAAASASPSPEPSPSLSPPRPRWRDLAGGFADPAEGGGQASDPNATGIARGSPKEPDSYCHFDSKHHRIEDFRLPDLQGRLVRFQDLDSDLVLLDFWGTWCQPCMRSIPHLVDLQKRMGGKQLQVVGIACERDETAPEQRLAGVAKASKKLGINYPVLMSSSDSPSPLQKALQVKAYPTLILVDREGRILWQDQGATRLTMYRLDRMLNVAVKSPDGRRRY